MDRATVSVYEERAHDWVARRTAGGLDAAARLSARMAPGAVRADLGCGPGWHAAALGTPLVALDAARAMLDLVAGHAPGAWRVQADIEAPPLRDRALGGAWASASYLHVARDRMPLALARLHWMLAEGAPVHLSVRHGDNEGALGEGGDFPGRFLSEWRPDPLRDVLVGAGFDVDAISLGKGKAAEFLDGWANRARTLPDTVGPGMRLLVCGLNPSVYAADRGTGFARPTNRFWRAAGEAGLVSRARDPLHALVEHGIGMTDLVKRATPAAAELTRDEYRAGLARVERLVRWLRPGAVCFVGLAGWRAARDRQATVGDQPDGLGDAPVYVMPSTSGLNTHADGPALAGHLRAAAALAR